jgi:hypothetical protein
MSGPALDLQFVVKRLTTLYIKKNLIRFKIARAVLNRLSQLGHDKVVAEVQGYQSYIWTPAGRGREYRVWAPTLTTGPEGWLRERGMVAAPPVAINWTDVFRELLPVFTYQSIIVESVRNMLGVLTDIRLEEDYLAVERYDGSANYGDHQAWYYVASDGIKIDYAAPTAGGPEVVRVSYTTTTCPVRAQLKAMLNAVSRGVTVDCGGRTFVVQYSGADCPALDQIVTLLRQILDQQIHCPTDFPARITFLTGPLRGFAGLVSPDQFVAWDGSRAAVYELTEIQRAFDQAVSSCVEVMTREVCTRYGTSGPRTCPGDMMCVPADECTTVYNGTCEAPCGEPGEGRCCCLI